MILLLGVCWTILSFGFLWLVFYQCLKDSAFIRDVTNKIENRQYFPQTKGVDGGILLYSEGEYFVIYPTTGRTISVIHPLPPYGKHYEENPITYKELKNVFGAEPIRVLRADYT